MKNSTSKHQVYILRLWPEEFPTCSQPEQWSFSLENIETHAQHDFRTLHDFLRFLSNCTGLSIESAQHKQLQSSPAESVQKDCKLEKT